MNRRTKGRALVATGVAVLLWGVLGFNSVSLSGPPEDVRPSSRGVVESPIQPTERSSPTVRRSPGFAPQTVRPTLDPPRVTVKSLVAVRGQEDNHIMGVGLVTGLAGTGDTSDTAKQLVMNMLLTRNIHIDIQDLNAKNVAIVRVESDLPAGLKPGRRLPVRVSALGDAKSLEGGSLTFTELTDVTGEVVYATAAGPLTVGGFRVGGKAATAIRNHVTVATLPDGGKVEREVETSIVSDHGFIYLDVRLGQDTFGNTVRITEAINALYPGAATSLPNENTIRVMVPSDLPEEAHLAYLASLLEQEIEPESVARVLDDESRGLIALGCERRVPVLADIPSSLDTSPGEGEVMRSYSVTGMCCESCTHKLHDKVLGMQGVEACAVDLIEERVVLIAKGDVSSKEILSTLNFDKYSAVELSAGSS